MENEVGSVYEMRNIMMNMFPEYEEILINWQSKERINIERRQDLEIENVPSQGVLYQLYGDHHIYGRDVLLYIGITKDPFIRLKTHFKGVFKLVENTSVSVGRCANYEGNLEIPESILIANHKPAYNKNYIHFLHHEAMKRKIIVINNGYSGMLQTCSTNYWWVDERVSN